MKRAVSSLGRIVALIALGAGCLAAQSSEGLDPFARIHIQTGTKTDEGQRNAFGVGFGFNLPAAGGTFGLQLGYTANPGTITRAGIAKNVLGAGQSNSVVTVKHSTDIIGVRAQYGMEFNSDWSWHAGLELGWAKSRMETIGDFETGNFGGVDGAWSTVVETSSLAYSPFVGVSWKINQGANLEFNLLRSTNKRGTVTPSFSTTAGDYQRATPVYGDKNYSDTRLEIGYVFHF